MGKNIDAENTNKSYTILSNMFYCVKCTKEYVPILLYWVVISILVQVFLPILEMYLPKIVINEITSGSLESLITVVLLITGLFALTNGFKKFCEKYVYHKKISMGSYYIHKISQKGLTTDYANIETETFRTLQQESYRMCSNNESTLRNIYYVWISFLSGILGFIFYSSILSQLNIIILIFLIISSIAGYFISLLNTKWLDKNNAQRTKYHHKLGYIDTIAEDIKSAKDIRLYQMESWFQKIYDNNIKKIAKWYKMYDKVVIKTSFANSSISLLREGVAYAYLIYLAFNNQINVGDFVLYFAAITGFSSWLTSIIGQLTEMKRISIYITKLRNYLDFPETFKREGGIKTSDKMSAPCIIELKNVSYRYSGAKSDTLQNINLTINAGEHIGIVGINGAGKTTLVKLICGLINPTSGEILYDGVNIKEYNRIEFYNLFSAVFQQYSLLPLSIEEAIAETTAENINSNKVELSIKSAGLWEKISSLPKGAKSMLDKSINDNAVAFSGGEIQKLLLARAIYKDSPVLMLDEPTAALDPIAETKLYESYHDITKGKTSIFISHRLSSTRFCDYIILINNGEIEEIGTHLELLENKGLYFSLFETQAKYYREGEERQVTENEEAF